MSYSYEMLAAFSRALARLHRGSCDAKAQATAAAVLATALRRARERASPPDLNGSASPAETDEAHAYLIALLGEHFAFAARQHGQPNSPAAGKARLLPLQQLGLTDRECEVLFWITEGKRDAEIATLLGCAPRTIGKHVEHVLAKLEVETRQAAANCARAML